MTLFFTRGSAAQYETILYGRMTPGMAAEYLREKRVSVRSFSQTLRQMYPGTDLENRKEDLRACYLRNLPRFGKFHLRSYYYFDQYMKILGRPRSCYYKNYQIQLDAAEQEEPDYSIEAVMNTYLSLHMPVRKKYSNYSLVQRLIKENWPSATSIKNIRNRSEDVPRKLLLLMYVVTEDSGLRNAYREVDEDYISLEERVEVHWWTLGAMLADCGMAPLDLRNAFDWLILYAIAADREEAMSSRLEMVLDALYKNVR